MVPEAMYLKEFPLTSITPHPDFVKAGSMPIILVMLLSLGWGVAGGAIKCKESFIFHEVDLIFGANFKHVDNFELIGGDFRVFDFDAGFAGYTFFDEA